MRNRILETVQLRGKHTIQGCLLETIFNHFPLCEDSISSNSLDPLSIKNRSGLINTFVLEPDVSFLCQQHGRKIDLAE